MDFQSSHPERPNHPEQRGAAHRSQAISPEIASALAQIMSTGLPLPLGLREVAKDASRPLRKALLKIATQLETGQIWTVPAAYAAPTTHSMTGFLDAAQRTGRLGESLAHLSRIQHQIIDLRRDVMRAIAYPCVLTILASVSILTWVHFAMPKFLAVADSLGADSNSLVQTDVLRVQGFAMGICLLVAATVILLSVQFSFRRRLWSRWWSGAPVLGRFLEWQGSIEFAELMAVAMELQMTVPTALHFVSHGMQTAYLAAETRRLAQKSQAGQSLSQVLRNHSSFPMSLVHWTQWGEQTNNLPESLRQAAVVFHQRTSLRVVWLRHVLPHFVALGTLLFVSSFVFSIVRPLITLIKNLT